MAADSVYIKTKMVLPKKRSQPAHPLSTHNHHQK